jgi:Fibronectin type III domain
MVQVNFAGNGAPNGFDSAASLYSPGIGLPTGRTMANGGTGCLINALYGYATARTTTHNVQLALGSAATAAFTIGTGSSAGGTGWQATNGWLVSGGTASFYLYTGSSSTYFGRTSTSGTVNTFDGGPGFTGTLAGWYQYAQSPPAMAAPTLASTGSNLTVTFTGPSDSGDGTISSYYVQYSQDPTFSTTSTVAAASSPATITGLASGLWYVRVSSSNEATAAASTYAPWSTATSQQVGIGGWRYSSGAEVNLTTAKRWDSTANAEVTITTAVRWDAVAGVEVNL